MSQTVGGAFARFRELTVDLEPDVTKAGRSSRNFLIGRLASVASTSPEFPRLASQSRPYGSFARRTKIQPLNDIDFLLGLNGTGVQAETSPSGLYTYRLRINRPSAPLATFPDQYGYVNSTRVLNAIKNHLAKVPNYSRASITKNGEVVTLNLSTRPWKFDIVPSIEVVGRDNVTAYFLIPNGSGNWIRTDPRIDDANTTRCNTRHGGLFLPTIRLLKYWNRRIHKPQLPSYYFETIAIHTFSNVAQISDLPSAIHHFFQLGPMYVGSSCADPKGLGPALDRDIAGDTKNKVITAMQNAARKAAEALGYQQRNRQKDALVLWGQIFGPDFPPYG